MHSKRQLIIGTRGSALALRQTETVIAALQANAAPFTYEVRTIKTKGDLLPEVALSKLGGKGAFVQEIEQALLDGTIDLAVHSMKDLPTTLPDGLIIGAVTERLSPLDVYITKNGQQSQDLPPGARIGTSSLRRQVQLLHLRPDFNIVPLRGNIDTRLRKLVT